MKEWCKKCNEYHDSYTTYLWKSFNEFMFWDNTLFGIVSLIVLVFIFKVWGLLIWVLLLKGLTAGGGQWLGTYDIPHRERTGCIKGRKNCPVCKNKKMLAK